MEMMKQIVKKFSIIFKLSITLSVFFFSCENEDANTQTPSDNLLSTEFSYTIVETGQLNTYNNLVEISNPTTSEAFYGQDANYTSFSPNYQDNGNGTITDLVTGLMWQQDPGEKMTWDEANEGAATFELAGYTDWRLPTIKELYSLIMFYGTDPSGYDGSDVSGLTPFINTNYFVFEYGDPSVERIIDAQFASSTLDVGDTEFGGGNLMFGVNFADGRIKGYPTGAMPGQTTGKKFFVYYVRGNTDYGQNAFTDNGDGTISDEATGLMWMQTDNKQGVNWEDALTYAENLEFAGYSDWRLPDAKELQSIVDYTRAPATTNSAAIDPLLSCSEITNEGGQTDYPYYWTGTTHINTSIVPGGQAVYLSFGRALGYFNGEWIDVHGAGAQRSDPKTGNPDDYPEGHGPQGDAIRILNYVRCVRSVK